MTPGASRPANAWLINGSSGGDVGTFAVQLAKHLGAHVTAVCSTPNVEPVMSLGADEVIDYTRTDFTRTDERYDLVVDNVGNRSILALRRLLAPSGRAILIGAMPSRWLAPLPRLLAAKVISRFGSRRIDFMLAHVSDDDMATLNALVEDAVLTPVIDRCYPIERAAEAIAYLETLRARGKVIVTV